MSVKQKIASSAVAILIGVGLSTVAVQSASANTWDPYCSAHFYDNNQTLNPSNNKSMWCQVQGGIASDYGYTGPVNGIPGVNTYKALQRYLQANWGYTAGIDGVLGVNSYKAMQRAAVASGWVDGTAYTGPIDGTMAQRDWAAWAYHARSYIS